MGVDDDTLKWTSDPLGVVRWQRSLGVQAVRLWVPWSGEAAPTGPVLTELARSEAAATQTQVVLAVFGFGRDTPTDARSQAPLLSLRTLRTRARPACARCRDLERGELADVLDAGRRNSTRRCLHDATTCSTDPA